MTRRKITSFPRERGAVDEMWTCIPIDKKPKARHVLGLGKPTSQEPCNDESWKQQNKEKVLSYSEHALRDYNKKHGTDLMLQNLKKYEVHISYPAHTVDFKLLYRKWIHINLEARCLHSEKLLLLFAELYIDHDSEPVLTRLSLLPPVDNLQGNRPWPCTVRLPFHRFRAGFDDNWLPLESRMGNHDALLAKFALTDYNKKNGTRLEFVKDARCSMFIGKGLTMDFNEKETIWKHLNFVARRPKRAVCFDEHADCCDELLLFAELYVGDHDEENVLATLSVVVGPQDNGAWCKVCPASILHPGFDCFH